MKYEENIELKAFRCCNDENERQPTTFTIIKDGKEICSTTDLLLALQAFLNRLS